jgi:recombination associated protein RdgC
MGLLTSVGSISRYSVDGKIKKPIIETVAAGLKKNIIFEIDGSPVEKNIGWVSLDHPYTSDSDDFLFSFGTRFVFSLRVDKKSIPKKLIRKYSKRKEVEILEKSGREYLSRDEKKMISEQVQSALLLKVPSTPNIYDLIWEYEAGCLHFFSTLKTANEDLETLFKKSFGLTIIRLFPYVMADFTCGLSDQEKDVLSKCKATTFRE